MAELTIPDNVQLSGTQVSGTQADALKKATDAYIKLVEEQSPEKADMVRQALEKLHSHKPTASRPQAAFVVSSPEREEGIYKIADSLRHQFFEGIKPEEATAREQRLDEANRTLHPQSKGYFTDFAAKIYDMPATRMAFLGTDDQKNAALQQLAQEQIGKAGSQLRSLAERGDVSSIQTQLFGLIAGILDGTAPGMQPMPEHYSGTYIPREPYVPKPSTIRAEEVENRGRTVEHALAEFIRQIQPNSPNHVVDLQRMSNGNIDLKQDLEAYQRWEDLKARSSRPPAVTKDEALIRQNNFAAFVNAHAEDPRDHQLYLSSKAEFDALRTLTARSDEADKAGHPKEEFGIIVQPKRGPSR